MKIVPTVNFLLKWKEIIANEYISLLSVRQQINKSPQPSTPSPQPLRISTIVPQTNNTHLHKARFTRSRISRDPKISSVSLKNYLKSPTHTHTQDTHTHTNDTHHIHTHPIQTHNQDTLNTHIYCSTGESLSLAALEAVGVRPRWWTRMWRTTESLRKNARSQMVQGNVGFSTCALEGK